MSFVGPPFEHDIFFSYAHADVDRVGDTGIKAWCQRFAGDLCQALRHWAEFASLSLYLDESPRTAERLDETAEITPAVRKAAGSSALLCAVMSPWYLKSEWCTKERRWWDEGTRTLAPSIASGFDRVFVLRLMDTIEDEWPETFKDVEDVAKKGFWLYDRAKPKHQRMPFGWIGTDEDRAAYRQCVIEVSGRIGARLEEIQAHLEADRKAQRTLANRSSGGVAPDIFISYAREDQERVARLVAELERMGWSVFWDREIPYGESWYSHIGKALERAQCVIAVWSKHSVTSQWVLNEAEEGNERGALVPILLEPVRPPTPFRHINAADLSGWNSDSRSPVLDSLLRGLQRRLSRNS